MLPERSGRQRFRLDALLLHGLGHLLAAHDGGGVGGDFGDDVVGRAGGRDQTDPHLHLVAGHGVADRRHFGKQRAAAGAGDAQGAQFSGALFPEVPPISDTVPGYEVKVWIGMVAPNGTPDDIIARISTDATAIMRSEEMAKTMQQQGIEPEPLPPGPFWQRVTAEVARWTKIVKDAGVTPE